jgi:hypothetical protein
LEDAEREKKEEVDAEEIPFTCEKVIWGQSYDF